MSRTPNKALLDTNLLLLWLVSKTDPEILTTFKRVQMFTLTDVEILNRSLRRFPEQVTTPHILSETSNFIDQAPPQFRTVLMESLRFFIRNVSEIHRPAIDLIERPEFNSLGLTDSGALVLSQEAIVLTMDYRLSGKILAMGGNSLNFNQERSRDLANREEK